MSFKIEKGSYTNTLDSASLSGNQKITLPNATGTVALTNQLAKVATSGSYNDLLNKPNIPANQSGYITQTWRSGNNWYRKWSDGWIEQGGKQSALTVTLYMEYSETDYHILVTSYSRPILVFPYDLKVNGFSLSRARTYDDRSEIGCEFTWYSYGF